VSKRVSFGTRPEGPKIKASRVSKLCPEKAARAYQLPPGSRSTPVPNPYHRSGAHFSRQRFVYQVLRSRPASANLYSRDPGLTTTAQPTRPLHLEPPRTCHRPICPRGPCPFPDPPATIRPPSMTIAQCPLCIDHCLIFSLLHSFTASPFTFSLSSLPCSPSPPLDEYNNPCNIPGPIRPQMHLFTPYFPVNSPQKDVNFSPDSDALRTAPALFDRPPFAGPASRRERLPETPMGKSLFPSTFSCECRPRPGSQPHPAGNDPPLSSVT
jgi:hypothetical protein